MIDPAVEAAAALLAQWMPHQRWFTGARGPVEHVRVASATCLQTAEPMVWHLLLDVRQGRHSDVYQVPIVIRPDYTDRLEHAHIGHLGSSHAYDALHDKDAAAVLLKHFHGAEHTIGNLEFHTEPGAAIPYDVPALALPVDQSNTSLAYGDIALLKVFRRIQPGLNPDVEVHDVLTRAGNEWIAPLLGWVDGRWSAEDGEMHVSSLAMLQAFLTTASDGWALATASVRDLFAEGDLHADEVGGDFAAEAHRLGTATAHVHRTMAEVLPTSTLTPGDLQARAVVMSKRLDEAVAAVPELEPYAPGLRTHFDAVNDISRPVPAQRIHGDYHLGQVLRTVVGWKLVDFEGEPARPLADRVALDSPLRDVAGMLRSFDYAARYLLVTDHRPDDPAYEQIVYRAGEWSRRNRGAFCDGYAEIAGNEPRNRTVLLTAYETDKAIYEVVYEAQHRPAWMPIPMAAIARLADVSD
jgi:maltokinase